MDIKTRQIKLAPVKVKYTSGNNIPFGFVTKRDITQREAHHIIQDILGIDIDMSIEGYDKEEAKSYKEDYTDALNKFIKGDADWPYVNAICECYDDGSDDISVPAFIWMVSYLQEKGII